MSKAKTIPNRHEMPQKRSAERALSVAYPKIAALLQRAYDAATPGGEGPVTLEWRTFDGRVQTRQLYEIPVLDGQDWGEGLGGEGLPWRYGRLRMEANPKLTPFRARGLGSDVGIYTKLFTSNPFAASAVLKSVKAVVSAPWRIEKPEVPEYLVGRERQRAENERDEQWRFQQECWEMWQKPGQEYGWSDYTFQASLWPKVAGFYLGEILFSTDIAGNLDLLRLPLFRAPWTVRDWLFQGEQWAGVVQNLSQFTDTNGQTGDWQQVIPREKLLHIARVPKGSTDLEGTSALRPSYTYLKMLEDAYQLQALGIEVDALGTWIVTVKDGYNVDPDAVGLVKSHFMNYRAENVPAIDIPDGISIERMRPKDSMADLSKPIMDLERAAMLGMDSGHMLMSMQGVGSNAARASASGDAYDDFDLEAQNVERATERLFRVGLEIKFPNATRHYPANVRSGHVETRDKGAWASAVASLVSAGVISPGTDVENAAREELDLPLLEEDAQEEAGGEDVPEPGEDDNPEPNEGQEADEDEGGDGDEMPDDDEPES